MEEPKPTIRITSGPRWDYLISSLRTAIADLESFNGQHVVANQMLKVVRSALTAALAAHPIADEHLVHWVKGWPWDSDEQTPERLDNALMGQLAIFNVHHAECFLTDVTRTREFLASSPAPADTSPTTVAEFESALSLLISSLSSGEFVTSATYALWSEPLRLNGSEVART